jgi:hypothetical protein
MPKFQVSPPTSLILHMPVKPGNKKETRKKQTRWYKITSLTLFTMRITNTK